MLESRSVSYRCNGKSLVKDISLRLEPGKFCALLGPNGAGKSTLIKLLSGELKPSSGDVLLADRPLSEYTPPQLARQRALLAQSRTVGFPFNAFDVVMMGRFPHTNGRAENETDREIAESCLAETDSSHLAERIYMTLSGGEATRVDLSRVLAQDTEILMLDEPTNNLDPRHQVGVLRLCMEMAASGKAVAVCMHDLNLAAQYADHVVILKAGNMVAQGPPEEILTAELLHDVYEIPFSVWECPGGGLCVLPDPYQEACIG